MKYTLLILLLAIIPSYVLADENKFMCVTENFIDTSAIFNPQKKDEEFETKQLNKKFLLTITKKNIFVTDTNIEDKNSQETYIIVKRITNTKDIMSVTVNPIGVQSLVFNTRDKTGTKTFQGRSFTYVYYLKCN